MIEVIEINSPEQKVVEVLVAGPQGSPGKQGLQGGQGPVGPAGPTDYNLLTNKPDFGPPYVAAVLPTLDFDMTSRYGAPFRGNLVRSTGGGYVRNSRGVLVPTVANEPMVSFGADSNPLGTGFYGAYTNLLPRSEEFDNAAWTKVNTTILPNAAVAPDGATTMGKLVEKTTTNAFHYTEQSPTLTASADYTYSVFAKKAERSAIYLECLDKAGSLHGAFFNLATGVVGAVTGATTAKIEAQADGSFRCSIKYNAGTGAATTRQQVQLAQSMTVRIYDGDGVSGAYVWGAQLSQTAFPAPYLKTTTAAVTRNTDSMIISGTDFTDFFNPVEGTVYVEFTTPSWGTFPWAFSLDDGASDNRMGIFYNMTSNSVTSSVKTGGVTQAFSARSLAPGSIARTAMTYKVNDFRHAVNGVSGTTDTSGSVPSCNALRVGHGDFTLNSNMRRLTYWPKALTVAQLEDMTK